MQFPKQSSIQFLICAWIFHSTTAWVGGHWNNYHNQHRQLQQQKQQRRQASLSTTRCFYRPPNKEVFNTSNVDPTSTTTGTPDSRTRNTDASTSTNTVAPQRFGGLGDIMSPTKGDDELLFQDGLVTSEAYSLATVYGIDNPLDRMAVTANGNLQRLFSSYYDAPVEVTVDFSRRDGGDDDDEESLSSSIWHRRVNLIVYNQTFCTAESKVMVHDRECQRLVESGQVGLGQLFRFLNILPEFALQAAGPSDDGGFWRDYTLTSSMVTCSIHEKFCPNVWELKEEDEGIEEEQ